MILVVILPIEALLVLVNHRAPPGPTVMPSGPPMPGLLKSVITPEGVMRPIVGHGLAGDYLLCSSGPRGGPAAPATSPRSLGCLCEVGPAALGAPGRSSVSQGRLI